LIWLSINTARKVQQGFQNSPTTTPGGDECIRSTTDLIDLTDIPCCCIGGFATDTRYVVKLNAVVGPTPVWYLDACAGFCDNGSYNPSTEMCTNSSSNQFTACVNLTKPVNCTGSAMPVAIDGITFYYIQSATDDTCNISSLCAPNPNLCVIPTGLGADD
jgi:hypothetical protein